MWFTWFVTTDGREIDGGANDFVAVGIIYFYCHFQKPRINYFILYCFDLLFRRLTEVRLAVRFVSVFFIEYFYSIMTQGLPFI